MIDKLTNSEKQVLNYFIQNPSSEIHVRGLSKEIGVSYSTVRTSLKTLEEADLLKSDKKSKMVFYSAEGEKFREAKKIANLENLIDSDVVKFLEKNLKPEAIVLFGSYLEGRDNEDSDIDIAVINGRDKELDLDRFEEKLGRTIELTQIENLENETKEFRNTLANGLVVQGYLEVA